MTELQTLMATLEFVKEALPRDLLTVNDLSDVEMLVLKKHMIGAYERSIERLKRKVA